MASPALSVTNLNKSYSGELVVDDLSFDIQPGEIFGLLGPNGAGKSTTINMISGVSNIDSGTIQVFGHDNQKEYRITRSMVGVMHQEVVMEPFFRIEQALGLHSGFYGMPDDTEWRELLLDRLDLQPHRRKKFRHLSGGMKRRYMIAKAMIHRPRLLILDEPTAGVDVELRHALWNFIREMNQQGLTILLTTHYLEEAESMCDRIGIMNHGKLITLEKTGDLIQKIGERKLAVHFEKIPDRLPEKVQEFELCRSEEQNKLIFRVQSGRDIMCIIEQLRNAGAVIDDVDTIRPDLEDVFLKLTGDDNQRTA